MNIKKLFILSVIGTGLLSNVALKSMDDTDDVSISFVAKPMIEEEETEQTIITPMMTTDEQPYGQAQEMHIMAPVIGDDSDDSTAIIIDKPMVITEEEEEDILPVKQKANSCCSRKVDPYAPCDKKFAKELKQEEELE